MLLMVRVEENSVSSCRTQLPHRSPGLPQRRPITANRPKSRENVNMPASSRGFVRAAAAQLAGTSAQGQVRGPQHQCKSSVPRPGSLADHECGECLAVQWRYSIASLPSPCVVQLPRPWACLAVQSPLPVFSPGPEPWPLTYTGLGRKPLWRERWPKASAYSSCRPKNIIFFVANSIKT